MPWPFHRPETISDVACCSALHCPPFAARCELRSFESALPYGSVRADTHRQTMNKPFRFATIALHFGEAEWISRPKWIKAASIDNGHASIAVLPMFTLCAAARADAVTTCSLTSVNCFHVRCV